MNILLITSDQQRWDCLGRQNPEIRTPNLDRLADRGILFDRAYTVNPVCTPTRCSILTSEYPSRHGCFHVGTSLPENYGPTVADRFSDAGYATSLIGKAHFQACKDPASLESAPKVHDLDHFDDWFGPYFGFDHAELVIGHTSEPHASGMHYGAWLRNKGVDTTAISIFTITITLAPGRFRKNIMDRPGWPTDRLPPLIEPKKMISHFPMV